MKKLLIMAIALQASFTMAAYVDFDGQDPFGPTVGAIDEPLNWPGDVFPSGSTTGVIAFADNVWIGTGVLQDIAVRLESGFINGIGDLAMRGGTTNSGITTIIEIDDPDTDYAGHTNFTISSSLTMWSQHQEKMELSILSGHVETPILHAISADEFGIDNLGTINMGSGILHVGSMDGGAVNVNMLAGGTGAITWDLINVGMAGIPVNFASDNLGSFTLGAILAGETNSTTGGIWEWMIANERISIDGTVETNASSYIVTYSGTNGWAGTIRLPGALTPEENYAAWAASYGLVATNTSGSTTNDFELDGLDNLTEYALGGNPTVDDADSINPTISGPAGALEYVYTRRLDGTFRGLTYGLTVTTDDLTSPTWTPIGTALETGSGSIDVSFESVTNTIPTDTPIGFINLEVTPTF